MSSQHTVYPEAFVDQTHTYDAIGDHKHCKYSQALGFCVAARKLVFPAPWLAGQGTFVVASTSRFGSRPCLKLVLGAC